MPPTRRGFLAGAGLLAARDQARGLGADLIVHYRDGSVQERQNFV